MSFPKLIKCVLGKKTKSWNLRRVLYVSQKKKKEKRKKKSTLDSRRLLLWKIETYIKGGKEWCKTKKRRRMAAGDMVVTWVCSCFFFLTRISAQIGTEPARIGPYRKMKKKKKKKDSPRTRMRQRQWSHGASVRVLFRA